MSYLTAESSRLDKRFYKHTYTFLPVPLKWQRKPTFAVGNQCYFPPISSCFRYSTRLLSGN